MQIFAKTPSGKSTPLEVEENNTIGNVKVMIQKKIGFQPVQQTLSFDNNQLEDNNTLSHYNIVDGNDKTSIAQALYTNEMMSIGWGYVSITTNSQFNDSIQAEAAGYIEGYLSYEMIWQYRYNIMVNQYNNKSISSDIINWAEENLIYMKQQIYSNPDDPYWIHVGLVLSQLNGLTDGYNAANQYSDRQLTLMDFLLLNMNYDIGDIMSSLSSSSSKLHNSNYNKNDHCSALIKLTDNLSELFTGHTTWSSYTTMIRIIKSYNFKFSTPTKSKTTMFSSYPGVLASFDDFYMLDSRLVVMETTNGILGDSDLYKLIKPQSILSWLRVIVTNRIASNGKLWCETFEQENSGTYNNQWMIVDYNKFIPGVKVKDGTLYVLEQLPGYVEYSDVTNILRTGYWPSFNVPYFETITNMSGFSNASLSGYESYEEFPRSQIFRRSSNDINSITEFQSMLRYNDFQNDPLSYGDAGNQISSRFDLNTKPNFGYAAAGGIDSKVTSLELINQFSINAQSGPTHDQQPPFKWSSSNWSTLNPTIGMPDSFDFNWVTFFSNSFESASSSSSSSSLSSSSKSQPQSSNEFK